MTNTMPRTMLTDIRWELLLQVMKSTGPIYDKTELQMTFEGILYSHFNINCNTIHAS